MFNKFNNWLFRPIFHVKQRLFLTAHTMGHPIDFQGPKTSGGKRRAGADEPGGKTLAGTNVCETIV